MRCDKHEIEYDVEEKYSDLLGRVLRFGSCPECDREIEQQQEIDALVREEAGRRARFESYNIEPMYYETTLDTFKPESDEQKRALNYAKDIVRNKTGKLVLLGTNGTGKTHLAVGVVRQLGGAIYSMYEITTRIRASYVSGSKVTELEIVEELASLPMLAIDEIGRTKGSDAETNWLSFIIDKRHTRGLPLILISNKHPRKTCPDKGCNNCLENYISEDIMSRLAEDGHLVTMTGADYRRVKREQL